MKRFWDSQVTMVADALNESLINPTLGPRWIAAGECFLDAWDALSNGAPSADALVNRYFHLRESLIQGLVIESPVLPHVFGLLLATWLPGWFFHLGGMAIPPECARPRRIWRLGPDNPITFLRRDIRLNDSKATRAHRRQIEEYLDSLEPVARRGRPPGSGGNRAYTEDDFHQAYRALKPADKRLSQEEIAAELGIDPKTLRRYIEEYGLP